MLIGEYIYFHLFKSVLIYRDYAFQGYVAKEAGLTLAKTLAARGYEIDVKKS